MFDTEVPFLSLFVSIPYNSLPDSSAEAVALPASSENRAVLFLIKWPFTVGSSSC